MLDVDELSDVGIGVVYEQFMLNRLLARIAKEHSIGSALEAPVFGMSGISGLNSLSLPARGITVSLADEDQKILDTAKKAWDVCGRKGEFFLLRNSGQLPFRESSFDLVYNFASLWHQEDPGRLISEMARVSRKCVLICMPNPRNPLFQIRKILGMLPKNHRWTDSSKIRKEFENYGFEVIDTGIFDIPPWPDIVISLKSLFGVSRKTRKWRWSMLDYYKGDVSIEKRIRGFSFFEDSPSPNFIKRLWAHHFYVLAVCRRKDGTGQGI